MTDSIVNVANFCMRKMNNRGVKYVYPVELVLPTKKIKGSLLFEGEVTIETLYAQVRNGNTGNLLGFEYPTGMPHVKNWGNSIIGNGHTPC